MLLYKVVIETTGHFVTPIKGDTLFGHFCWSYRESFGESRLEHDILNGYTQSQPKIIFSDAYAHGYFYLPKYAYDLNFELSYDATQRKQIKGRKYLSQDIVLNKDVSLKNIWQDTIQNKEYSALNAQDAKTPSIIDFVQTHNTINRNIGTTSSGIFAPYNVNNFTYKSNKDETVKLDIFVMIDEVLANNCGIDEISKLIANIGLQGFGADASIGKGKFNVDSISEIQVKNKTAKSGMTLAPALVSENDNVDKVYYDTFTRFGRHGNIMAHSKQVFKLPITLMNSNAFVVFRDHVPQYIGNGFINSPKFGEDKDHNGYIQAYSMIIPLNLE